MKYSLFSYAALALGLVSSVAVADAALKSAEITRLHNDVRVRSASSSERAAEIGDQISGETMVRTGMESRAELKFNDDTLSRLGANTVFSFERGTRNMQVGSGTLFLQVPKDAGGATINTAAVTAAVTGTTIMIEIDGNNVVKIIVLEGTLDLSLNGDLRVKQTLRAGEMIVMKPDAGTIPQPVNVDLDLLIKTSKLINEDEFDKLPPTAKSKIAEAVDNQQKRLGSGELTKTNLVIPGSGSRVILTDHNFDRRLATYLAKQGEPQAPATKPRDTRPPSDVRPPLGNQFAQLTRPVLQSGLWNINDTTVITTNPTIFDGERIGQGTIYVPALAGSFTQWAFGQPDSASGGKFQQGLNNLNAWSVFLLENMLITGTPSVIKNGPQQLIFASPNEINFGLTQIDGFGDGLPQLNGQGGGITSPGSSLLDLDVMGLRSLVFTTQGAAINLAGMNIAGQATDLGLLANGPGGDININTSISLGEGGFYAYASRDLSMKPGTDLRANKVEASGRGMVDIDNARINAGDLFIDSGGSVTVTNSSELLLLTSAAGTGGMIGIRSQNGNVEMRGFSSVRADGPMQTLEIETSNGDILLGTNQTDGTDITLSASSLVAFRASGANQPTISLDNVRVNSEGRIDFLARGSNASVMFGGFNRLDAQDIRIFAEGSGSLIRFTGYTELNADQVRLAARRILVDPQAQVNINAPTLGIFADQHNYNLNGLDESPYGNLNSGDSATTIGTYDQR